MNCPKCGSECWDNRPKKLSGEIKPNAPDFKCKNRETCDWVQWPPKEKQTKAQVQAFTPAQQRIVDAATEEAPRPVTNDRVALFWDSFDSVLGGLRERKLTDMFNPEAICKLVATLYIGRH